MSPVRDDISNLIGAGLAMMEEQFLLTDLLKLDGRLKTTYL